MGIVEKSKNIQMVETEYESMIEPLGMIWTEQCITIKWKNSFN